MSNFDRYAAAISEFFDNCNPETPDELQEVIHALEVGLVSAVGTINTLGTERETDAIADHYCDSLRNLTWLALPSPTVTDEISIDRAVTTVCALSAAKAHFLGQVYPEKEMDFKNEFIESVQRCCVAAVLSTVTTAYREQIDEEVVDAMRSEYMDQLSEVNKAFVDRWSEFLLSRYGVGFKTRKV